MIFFLAVYCLCALALIRASAGMGRGPRWAAQGVSVLALIFCITAMATSDLSITRPAFIVLAATIPIWLLLRFRRALAAPA